jgi:hypothetical protein
MGQVGVTTTLTIQDLAFTEETASGDTGLGPSAMPAQPTPMDGLDWDALPVTVAYPPDPPLGYVSKAGTDIADAVYMGRQGHEVKQVSVQLGKDAVALALKLYDGNSFGGYAYTIRLSRDGRNLYLVLTPAQGNTWVSYENQSGWASLATSPLFVTTQNAARALVPYELFSSAVNPKELAAWAVDCHFWDPSDVREETFYLPGQGFPSMADVYYLSTSK